MKPIIALCLFILTDKIYFVDNSRPSLENGKSLFTNDFRNRSRFTKKIWVIRRRTPSNIINADSRRNSTRSAKNVGCGTPEILPNVDLVKFGRIINGKTAYPNSWPWLVSIRQSKNSNFYHVCAGSLISAQHVLTAAHCVSNFRNNTFAVFVGMNELSERITLENTYLIVRYLIHPDFRPNNFQNDIAILHLNLPVKISKKILPICLPPSNKKEILYEKEVIVIGWGSTNGYNSQKTLSNQLLQTTLQIKNFRSGPLCRGFDDVNYCALDSASQDLSNICYGDSGGSLMHQINGTWYLYGISSFIYGDSRTKKCISSIPSFYTIVPKYLDWILNYISN